MLPADIIGGGAREVTLIVPYYRNVGMLREQLAHWETYPAGVRVVLVDDGSPEPAAPIVDALASADLRTRLRVYRIAKDIPWNRGGARNLGAHVAQTPWLVHIDIDHVLPAPSARALLVASLDPARWYRFPRFRRGKADETRNKDAIGRGVEYGPIKPHCDSYLCLRSLYWQVGGYDENYSGCLGGGSPFLAQLALAAPVALLPPAVFLEVYTRDVVPDASDFSLSRDTREYSRRRKAQEAAGKTKAVNPMRFEWSRLL